MEATVLFRKKIHTLLVKGAKAMTLEPLVGTTLTILTRKGNPLDSKIIDTNLRLDEEPLGAEFQTEHGVLLILERNENIGMYFGEPIDPKKDQSEQQDGGESIRSVTIAGIEIINNGLEKLLTEEERRSLA